MDKNDENRLDDYGKKNYNLEKFRTYVAEYDDFEKIFEIYIRELNLRKAISSVVVESKGQEFDLLEPEQRRKYFDYRVEKQGTSQIKKLLELHAPIQSETWRTYVERKTPEDQNDLLKTIQTQTWNTTKGTFFEWLIALLTIIHFGEDEKHGSRVIKLSPKALSIKINHEQAYLWYQANIRNDAIFDVKPDFLITSSPRLPEQDEPVMGIIECKAAKNQVAASTTRDIFGKGWDLNPDFILVLCHESIDSRKINKLEDHYGIDVLSPFNVNDMKNGSLYKQRLEKVMQHRRFARKIRQKHDMKSGLRLNEV